jgi:hypothetical protein
MFSICLLQKASFYKSNNLFGDGNTVNTIKSPQVNAENLKILPCVQFCLYFSLAVCCAAISKWSTVHYSPFLMLTVRGAPISILRTGCVSLVDSALCSNIPYRLKFCISVVQRCNGLSLQMYTVRNSALLCLEWRIRCSKFCIPSVYSAWYTFHNSASLLLTVYGAPISKTPQSSITTGKTGLY